MFRTRERFRFGLTDAGRAVVRGTVFVALAAFIVPAFGVLCALACVLLTALIVGFLLRPRVRIDGRLPDRMIAGQSARLTYTLTNVGRLATYHLDVRFDALPETIEQVEGQDIVSRLGRGDSAEVAITIRPTRRGRYRIGQLVCRSAFPFNLFWFGASRRGEETLLVLPSFCRLQMFQHPGGPRAHTAGARLAAHIGGSPEYRGNRPFVPGDSPRRIDARAWARLAAPATKEYDEDCDLSAALVLDAGASALAARSKSAPMTELEAAVSLCASTAFTINSSCFIDLLLAGEELHCFAGLPRDARLDRVHELLAGVESSKNGLGEQAIRAMADRFYEMSQVIFILQRWDDAYQHLYDLAERAGCSTSVLLVGRPDPQAEKLPSAAGSGESTIRTPIFSLRSRIANPYAGDIRILSPDEILSGRVRQL